MRKPIALFVAAFATVAGGGLAMALESTDTTADADDAEELVPDAGAAVSDATDAADDDPAEDGAADDGAADDDAADESEEADESQDPAAVTISVEEPTTEGSHGEWVSRHAQEDCSADGEATETEGDAEAEDAPEWRNHGECVSAAARDRDHDGTPDNGRGSPDHPVFPAEATADEDAAADDDAADDASEEPAAETAETESSGPGNGHGRGRGGR